MALSPQRYRPPGAVANSKAAARQARQSRGGDFYDSAEWRNLRTEFLSANPLCEWCLLVGIVTAANTVDHRQPRRTHPQLALTWSNLRSSCGPCHSRYGATADRAERTPTRGG